MVKAFSRKVIGLGAALVLSLVPAVSQPLSVAASGGGTLFALGPGVIGKVDPSTGAFTTFAGLPLPPPTQPFPSFGGLASDPVGHRLFTNRTIASDFFFTSVTYQMITINTQTAAVSISPDMAQGVGNLVFDPSSGSLFGQTNVCCPFQVVRIDPGSGVQTHVADIPGVQPLLMTDAPARHSLYLATQSFVLGQFQPVITLVTIDTSTGVVSQSPPLATGIFAMLYDSVSDTLFGKTFCCPASLVRVDPVTGVETVIAPGLAIGPGIAIDSATHTVFMTADQGFSQLIQSINDQTGASSFSTGAIPATTYVSALAFEGVAITPESIKADVRSGLASGAITNPGIANSLLAELSAAQAARSRGQCTTAANVYQAFINEVNAQAGRAIASATATKLVGEAQFLITHCP